MRPLLPLIVVCACAAPPLDPNGADSTGADSTGADSTGADSTDTHSNGGAGSTSATGDSTGEPTPPRACNGHVALCDRRLDALTIATTHNSAASVAAGFTPFNANQNRDLRDQLDDGVRGMMLDVTLFEDDTWLCHGPCGLGKVRHTEAIGVLGDFLAEHPNEVLFIIYEDSAPADAIAADWADVGLESLLYVHGGGTWPTLGAMIEAGTRVVVTAENAAPPPAWLHHAWDLIWDTPYTFHDPAEFSCDPNRGTPGSGLLLVNHWISTDADLPDADAAAAANAQDALLDRAQSCADAWDHPVNLLAVDFYDEGDLFAVVDAMNGV